MSVSRDKFLFFFHVKILTKGNYLYYGLMSEDGGGGVWSLKDFIRQREPNERC